MKRLMLQLIMVSVTLCCVLGSSSVLADEPLDSASVPDPSDSLLQVLLQSSGNGITLPSSGTVELTIMKTETSSLEDVLALTSPSYQTLTSNARNCVGCKWDLGWFEAESELVFTLDNQNPKTGPNQVTIYPRITGNSPLWSLNFEDWKDSDWDDVIATVRFYPDTIVKVKQITFLDDINIENIDDLIWDVTYDDKGEILSIWKGGPVADAMRNSTVAGKAKLEVELEGFPALPSTPLQVECSWHFSSQSWGGGSFEGNKLLDANNEVLINMPQVIGQYNLTLYFEIRDNDGNYISYQDFPGLTTFVTWDNPNLIASEIKANRLDKAVNWASPANTEVSMVDGLNAGIYYYGQNHWLYRDLHPGWMSLVDGAIQQGNCFSFSEVWEKLGALLGSDNTERFGPYKGEYLEGFLTKPATSMDGLNGNTYPCEDPIVIDRWLFGSHVIGSFTKPNSMYKYYDPTFGDKYSTSAQYVQWNIIGPNPNGTGLLDDGSHLIHILSGPTATWLWGLSCYEDILNGTMAMNEEHNSPFISNMSSDSGVDTNGDGLFEYLHIGIDVDVDIAGDYTIMARLMSNDSLITKRSHMYSTMISSVFSQQCDVGIETFDLQFSGQDIYKSGFDGNYQVVMSLTDENISLIDTASFFTTAYVHTQFREVTGEITGASDYGEDIDNDGLFDYLTVDVSLETVESGWYRVQGFLITDSTYFSSTSENSTLQIGANTVTIRFDGNEIRDYGIDAPYTLKVNLYAPDGYTFDSPLFQTSSYSYTDFDSRVARFTGSFTDHATDTNLNGKYDILTIEADIEVEQAGDYLVSAWLQSQAGEDIASARTNLSVSAGTHTVAVDFDGKYVYQHGVNGPYELIYIVIEDADGKKLDELELGYSTYGYSFSTFEPPSVTVTGTFNDYGWYSWIQPFWWLAIDIEINSVKGGYVSASAELYSVSGEYIVASSTLQYMLPNYPQMVRLLFDGRRIYGNQEDGPYDLRNLVVYHEDTPSEVARVAEAYTTSEYSFTQFSLAAVVDGTVRDADDIPIEGAILSINTWDEDVSDENGGYRLSVLDNGNYTIDIESPETMEIDAWVIYVNGDSVGIADSVFLPLVVGTVTQVDFKALPSAGGSGIIEGSIFGPSGGLLGVTIDLFDWNDMLYEVTVTDATGTYSYLEVPTGDYNVAVVTPLGFIANPEIQPVNVISGSVNVIDFNLDQIEIVDSRRGKGYWKHQVNVHLSGKGNAHESLEEMSNYLDQIRLHFNNNLEHPVIIFEVDQPANQTDSLESLRALLSANGGDMNIKARQHLVTLLLNVASLKLHQTTIVTVDGATVSQAITHCYDLIIDSDESNDETAKDIAEKINNGQLVDAGEVPLSTPVVAYKGIMEDESTIPYRFFLSENYPNPFNPNTEISFTLPEAVFTNLKIYNILGQHIVTLVDDYLDPGIHTVTWNGTSSTNVIVASGIYFYHFEAGDFVETKKMILLK